MRELLRPRWVAAHLVAVLLIVVFINLGFWQLERLEERRLENTVGESRYSAEVIGLLFGIDAAAEDVESLQHRRAVTEGAYRTEHEVLIRSQVFRGEAGFHVITPFLLDSETAVLVNRGWVPLALDAVPVVQAPPVNGRHVIEGWIDLTEERAALGPLDPPDGRLVAMNRVDIDRIQAQVPFQLLPVYLNLAEDGEGALPIAVAALTFVDEGPHLGYAVQWFGFTLIGIIGYFALIRRTVLKSR